MPAQPPPDPRHLARLYTAMIPDEVAKSISNAEYNDRLVEAARLSAQASDPALSPDLRQAAKIRAQAVLRAQPRQATEQQHAAMIAKAAATRSPLQAEAIRRHAERLIEQEHPIAPRRGAAVRKAKAAGGGNAPVVLFDADGRVLGICDPSDILPVDGAAPTGELTPQPPAEAGIPADAVGKSAGRVIAYDQNGRRLAVRGIRMKIRKAADDGLVTVTGPDGRSYRVSADVLRSAEAQARDTGPVSAGGTTGLGQPGRTGADGPQKALPGDVPGRQVVKAAGTGPGGVRTLGDARREGRLALIAKVTGQDLRRPHTFARNPFSPAGECVCEAPAAYPVHSEIAPGIPVDRRRVAKSSWSPQWSNPATSRWLAAQRRR
jgi:hypothetical protein